MILLRDVFPQMQTGFQGSRQAKYWSLLKELLSDKFCTTYFLRFIVYDIGRNVVQESGSDD